MFIKHTTHIVSKMISIIRIIKQRIILSITTIPNTSKQWIDIFSITVCTTGLAGYVGIMTNFISFHDYQPPNNWLRPISVFIFPSLYEELIWLGIILSIPSSPSIPTRRQQYHKSIRRHVNYLLKNHMSYCRYSIFVLLLHVLSHPIAGSTIWPRGRHVFYDIRFLLLATIVLGGSTLSFIISGGSIYAAAITHAIPVILWRDFFKGEESMMLSS